MGSLDKENEAFGVDNAEVWSVLDAKLLDLEAMYAPVLVWYWSWIDGGAMGVCGW